MATQARWKRSGEGGWAVVTGATSGIGLAFARRAAESGTDVLMIGRREELIGHRARSLSQETGRTCRVVIADLSTDTGQDACLEALQSLPAVDLLVNNAGFGLGRFLSDPGAVSRHRSMIAVHVMAHVRLTLAVLPGMLARRSGAIIFVSSLAGFFPLPKSSTYSASKAFLNVFAESLHTEVMHRGIAVQALCPGMAWTDFHERMHASDKDMARRRLLSWMSAERIVDKSLANLHRRRVVYVPGLVNTMIARVAPRIPRALYYELVRRAAGVHDDL
jgi:short-subunit dehydrogenase